MGSPPQKDYHYEAKDWLLFKTQKKLEAQKVGQLWLYNRLWR